MVNSNTLNKTFAALADPTRRSIIERLSHGPQTVEVLSPYYQMSAPAISKHLRVLEEARLIKRRKVSRNVEVSLNPNALTQVSAWVAKYQAFWGDRLEALAQTLENSHKQT